MQKGILDVQRKDDRSIVTQADIWAQSFIIDSISGRFPGFKFISEELPNSTADYSEDKVYVIIDPIDGTAMFSMHLPIWCVSVGIFRGYTPLYGFVYSPGSDLLFHNDNDRSYLNGKPLIAETITDIEKETNIFYSSEIKDLKIDFPGKIRNLGSTALHACLTADSARNRLIAFIGKSYLWDWAGALPLILKAGVKVRYLDGREIDIKEIIGNNFKLIKYAVAYNAERFDIIKKIFGQ